MRLVVSMACAALLAACTTELLYLNAQGWQLEQCRRLQDPAERSRCERSNARSYEDYQAEAEKARSSAPR